MYAEISKDMVTKGQLKRCFSIFDTRIGQSVSG